MAVYTVDFTEAACREVRSVGGKATGLAAMVAAGLPVAPGYVATASAYRAYLAQHQLLERTSEVLDGLDSTRQPAAFEEAAALLADILGSTPLPIDVDEQVRAGYRRLCQELRVPDVAVAVRSSATAEDSVGASFAGEFETWVDVIGEDSVVEHVARCYHSVFSARVLSYLAEKGVSPNSVEMAVVIQKTVRARAAGVMFTLSPTSGDRSKIVIEATWGLGLSVVGGEVTPDRYMVDKVGLNIAERALGHKLIEYRNGHATVPVEQDRQDVACLTDDEITSLAALGKQLEALHGAPQDIEFALDEQLTTGADIILLQCRPETVWSNAKRKPAFDTATGVMSWIAGSISGPVPDVSAAAHGHEDRAS